MQQLLTNVGDAEEIRSEVLEQFGTNSPVTLVLDRLRVMMIVSFRKVEEGIMTVQLRDVDDKTIVVLALPYTVGARAQAEITSFDDKEA